MPSPTDGTAFGGLILAVGQAFNPYRMKCGFYPPDRVRRIKKLSSGAKMTYERLVRFAGNNGACYPSQAKLAEELGVCDRQVRRYLSALEAERLIAWKRGGRTPGGERMASRYVFLWHQIFDRTSMSAPPTASIGHPCPVRPDANSSSTGRMGPTNSVAVSSIQEYRSYRLTDERLDPHSPNPSEADAGRWFTEGQSKEAQQRIAQLLRVKPASNATVTGGLVNQVLKGLRDFADFEDYIADVAARPECKPRTAAYFVGKLLAEWSAERRNAFHEAKSQREAMWRVEFQREQQRMEETSRREEEYHEKQRAEGEHRRAQESWTGPQIDAEVLRLRGEMDDSCRRKALEPEVERLSRLPAYTAWKVRRPVVDRRRADLVTRIEEKRMALRTFAKHPALLQAVRDHLRELEAELAVLDANENGSGVGQAVEQNRSSTYRFAAAHTPQIRRSPNERERLNREVAGTRSFEAARLRSVLA